MRQKKDSVTHFTEKIILVRKVDSNLKVVENLYVLETRV